MQKGYGERYKLAGASQYGMQWDKTQYIIQSDEIVERITTRLIRSDLFRVDSDGRIVKIDESIIDRYFEKIN